MAAADLERARYRRGDLARALGFARSLAIYYGQPWRLSGLDRLYREFLGAGDLAFDVGAHVGNRSRCWSRLGVRVVAVEPQPQLAAWLRWQFGSDPNVTVVESALGATPGTATLYSSRAHPTVATLSPDWIERVQRTGGFARVAWRDRCQVPLTTLDALIARHGQPRFCKIDVEGFEAEVLRGLSHAIPALSFEYLPAATGVALDAIARICELGAYRFNVTTGERARWLWPEWRGASELEAWLAKRRADDGSGDVYARLRV